MYSVLASKHKPSILDSKIHIEMAILEIAVKEMVH